MQFKGYHINNLKSYRKYFCFSDAAEALENGGYQEWLTGLSEMPEQREKAAGEDTQVIGEIRKMLDQIYGYECRKRSFETESRGDSVYFENLYQRLYALFFALAQAPVTEEAEEEIVRAARSSAKKRMGSEQKENRKTDSGAEISLTGEKYEIQIGKNGARQEEMPKENHLLFRWKKLINAGTVPLSILLMDGARVEASRCLAPGGFVRMLTLNGCFVKWGSRVQVDHRSFACVDRKGCLTVNGYPMLGAGMADFSFDQRTGILGVDDSGNLRQYSGLDVEIRTRDGAESGINTEGGLRSQAAGKEKIALACLDDKTYTLLKENGELITNLTDGPADFFTWRAAKGEITIPAGAADELPFSAVIVSGSDQLYGFETPDSRVGVWDRERKQLVWMEA